MLVQTARSYFHSSYERPNNSITDIIMTLIIVYLLSVSTVHHVWLKAEALEILEKLGRQYERDHEKDLKDTVYYLPGEAHALGWQDSGVATALQSFKWAGAGDQPQQQQREADAAGGSSGGCVPVRVLLLVVPLF